MLRNWTQRVSAWLQGQGNHASKRRRGARRRFDGNRRGAMIQHLETLESRRLLTSLVAVSVSGGAVNLTDMSGHRPTGDAFDVTYTSSQVVLTGHNGTSFQVGDQTLSTYTAPVTGNVSLTMSLGSHGNDVTVTGDGTTDLTSLIVNLGNGREGNSLTLTKVVADSITVNGGRASDAVTLSQCTINDDLNAQLGTASGDFLNLATTTDKGNVQAKVSQLVMNDSTITGTLNDVETRRNSSFNSTESTYTGAATIQMGRIGTINMLSSTDGLNQFVSAVSVTGTRHRPAVVNQEANAVSYAVKPTLTNASIQGSPAVTVAAPTVASQTIPVTAGVATTPTITGTFDSAVTPDLSVTAGGTTYTLGTDAQLTSPSTGTWSLNLGSPPLTAPLTVKATSSNSNGLSESATGAIATDAQAISAYLTANNFTATTTADGLNYVTTTKGTGAIPTAGQTLTVNYTGHILNADGTLGTEFDSNVDPQFNHVSPFSFTLGVGDVIAGWDEAFALLPVGTVAKLLIPSALAYGAAGSPPSIPANATLEFDVTLVSAT